MLNAKEQKSSLLDSVKSPSNIWSEFVPANELHAIEFRGNSIFDENALLGVISHRPTEFGLQGKIVRYFSVEIERMNVMTEEQKRRMSQLNSDIVEERRSFSPVTAATDCENIRTFYWKHGYHRATVTFKYKRDPSSFLNTLVFIVDEGRRSLLDKFYMLGFDSLSKELWDEVKSQISFDEGDPYDESEINNSLGSIQSLLRNRGYFFFRYDTSKKKNPLVRSDTALSIDTVTVWFDVGKRAKVGTVTFVDSTRGENPITNKLKQDLCEIVSNDWVADENISQTKLNFSAIGVFDNINIEPIPRDGVDSIVDFKVVCYYRSLWGWGVNGGTERYTGNPTFFASIQGYLLHRNVFGRAQQLKTTINFSTPIDQFFFRQSLMSSTVVYSQPYLLKVLGYRTDVTVTATPYSKLLLINPFVVTSSSLAATLTTVVNSPAATIIASYPDLSYSQQLPDNYELAKRTALSTAQNFADSNRIIRATQVLENKDPDVWSLGFSLSRDARNLFTNPSRGSFVNFVFQLSQSPTTYARYHFSYSNFNKINEEIKVGWKFKWGQFFFRDSIHESSDFYVPFNQMFFSGGAQSVRGWKARELWDASSTGANTSDLERIVGFGKQLEVGIEARYQFPLYQSLGEFWGGQLSKIGTVVFLDAGNSFNQLTRTNYKSLNGFFEEFVLFRRLAVSTGIELYYMTPVGPFRIVFPIRLWDPSQVKESRFLPRKLKFNLDLIDVGLGFNF